MTFTDVFIKRPVLSDGIKPCFAGVRSKAPLPRCKCANTQKLKRV